MQYAMPRGSQRLKSRTLRGFIAQRPVDLRIGLHRQARLQNSFDISLAEHQMLIDPAHVVEQLAKRFIAPLR
jgi:hypothetical protein